MTSPADLPQFEPWSPAAVKLLQGVVYFDEASTWDAILAARSSLEDYFARIGLLLVVDEMEGLAYLRQLADDEMPEGYDQVPKLFRRVQLGFEATLLCVLLRDELRRFDEEELQDQRCVIATQTLFDGWKSLAPSRHDEVRQHREFSAALSKLADLRFVRRFADAPESWEIRRILKARLPLAELEALREKMQQAVQAGDAATPADDETTAPGNDD